MKAYLCAGCKKRYHGERPDKCECGSVVMVELSVPDPAAPRVKPGLDEAEPASDNGVSQENPMIDAIVTAMLKRLEKEIIISDLVTASTSFKNVCQGLAALSLIPSPDTITNA